MRLYEVNHIQRAGRPTKMWDSWNAFNGHIRIHHFSGSSSTRILPWTLCLSIECMPQISGLKKVQDTFRGP